VREQRFMQKHLTPPGTADAEGKKQRQGKKHKQTKKKKKKTSECVLPNRKGEKREIHPQETLRRWGTSRDSSP